MGARRKAREYALQVLYLADISKLDKESALRAITKTENLDPKVVDFAAELVSGIEKNLAIVDKMITKYAKNWEINRMAALDRNILRLGTYELVFETETPVSVIIDEAVEIAKIFSTADSSKFVNGILDKIKAERKHEKDNRSGETRKSE